jgi:hypothetical protein
MGQDYHTFQLYINEMEILKTRKCPNQRRYCEKEFDKGT